jgi:hypothetical protein
MRSLPRRRSRPRMPAKRRPRRGSTGPDVVCRNGVDPRGVQGFRRRRRRAAGRMDASGHRVARPSSWLALLAAAPVVKRRRRGPGGSQRRSRVPSASRRSRLPRGPCLRGRRPCHRQVPLVRRRRAQARVGPGSPSPRRRDRRDGGPRERPGCAPGRQAVRARRESVVTYSPKAVWRGPESNRRPAVGSRASPLPTTVKP